MSGNNLKIAACTPVVHPGEVGANLEAVSSMIREAALCGAQLIVFPCNCLAGASCGEDILRFGFIESAVFDARREISALAAGLGVTVALDECLYAGYVSVIPAAEPELVTAQAKRRKALREFSRGRVVVWCNAGYGESTTDFVYGGGSMIWADGECLAENPRFGTGGAIIYAEVGFGAQGGCCSPLKTSATPTPPKGPLPLMVPRVAQFSGGDCRPEEDYRGRIHPKVQSDYVPRPYWQVFKEKFGFVPGLSVMDLLFNEGPESICFITNNTNI